MFIGHLPAGYLATSIALNFIFHWTFLLEIVVVGLALIVYIRRRTRNVTGRTA